ncbi:unnamed protein product [Microthlaspi erraticum]|uniref:Uncharacterized protein n=1 Tax=Microthlaspi erraticum TaxID=1685480 RepID=A0A6D2HDY6_9BRAS|nr:unnamed protein product [Microthlaspi erraticum]
MISYILVLFALAFDVSNAAGSTSGYGIDGFWPFAPKHVVIHNVLAKKQTLNVHCRSSDDDLGLIHIPWNGTWGFRFKVSFENYEIPLPFYVECRRRRKKIRGEEEKREEHTTSYRVPHSTTRYISLQAFPWKSTRSLELQSSRDKLSELYQWHRSTTSKRKEKVNSDVTTN